MTTLLQLSQQLYELTIEIHKDVFSGQLESFDALQDKRKKLVSELDTLSRQPNQIEDITDCQILILETRSIEKEITDHLLTLQKQIMNSRDEINLSKKALKIYDRFQ